MLNAGSTFKEESPYHTGVNRLWEESNIYKHGLITRRANCHTFGGTQTLRRPLAPIQEHLLERRVPITGAYWLGGHLYQALA